MTVFGPGALRLVLASLVVLSHASRLETGRPAVFLFFVLSGYWVMRMYDEKYRGPGGIAVFYLSRLLRLALPFVSIYVIALLLVGLGTGQFPGDMLRGVLIAGVASSDADILGVSWSIDIELQFYLLIPLLWGVLHRPGGWRALALLSLPLLWAGRALAEHTGVVLVLIYLPAFLLGLEIWRRGWSPSRRQAWISLLLAAGLFAGVLLSPGLQGLVLKSMPAPFDGYWFSLVLCLVLMPFIAFNVHQRSGAWDQHMGNLSYPLYLVHYPVLLYAQQMPGLPKLAAVVLAYGVALAAYLLIDRPAERLRQIWVRGFSRRRMTA